MIKISVLLADDHEVVRAGYHRLLESNTEIAFVAEAASGEEAYQRYGEYHPDVVVMDLTMPGIGGLEASRRIRAQDDAAKILVYSVHETEDLLGRALDLGILGYISKRSASRVMVEAVRQVAAGKVYIGQEMIPHLLKRTSSADSQQIAGLSQREFEVVLLLAESKSVNDIAEWL
ncbi:MAG: response regulator transcription factor, partial [Anaerolineae bacterium]